MSEAKGGSVDGKTPTVTVGPDVAGHHARDTMAGQQHACACQHVTEGFPSAAICCHDRWMIYNLDDLIQYALSETILPVNGLRGSL
jgi:hypothetical protein